jgi:hypothetical protein
MARCWCCIGTASWPVVEFTLHLKLGAARKHIELLLSRFVVSWKKPYKEGNHERTFRFSNSEQNAQCADNDVCHDVYLGMAQ